MKRAALIIVISLAVAASGCSSLGPKSLKGNRIDYNISVHKSNNEDLLVNIVRASYFEPVFFLQVNSISASFNYGATASASGALYERSSTSAPNLLGANLGASYSEVPTITYAPLQGQQAVKQLMSEIPIDRFFLLTRSGWNVASLLWTMTQQIGDLRNYEVNWKTGHPLIASYHRFLDLSQIWEAMQHQGDLELPGLEKGPHGLTVVPVVMTFTSAQEADRVDRLLGIKPSRTQLPDSRLKETVNLSSRCVPEINACVPMRLRSFYGIISDLSQTGGEYSGNALPWIQPVPEDLKKRPGFHQGLIRIRKASSAPSDAYVSVLYQNAWFYIDAGDFRSKAYMTVLGTLFSLQAMDVPLAQPLLTLPSAR